MVICDGIRETYCGIHFGLVVLVYSFAYVASISLIHVLSVDHGGLCGVAMEGGVTF